MKDEYTVIVYGRVKETYHVFAHSELEAKKRVVDGLETYPIMSEVFDFESIEVEKR